MRLIAVLQPVALAACLGFAGAQPPAQPEATAPAPPAPPSAAAPGSSPPAAPKPPESRPGSALESLSPAIRAAATRRAKFVFRLPDGSIWDSFYYAEFRAALAEFDSATDAKLFPARPRAWGFARGQRYPSTTDRPTPLWHSLQLRDPAGQTPFMYVNTSLLSDFEKKKGHVAEVGKEVADNIFEVKINEFPGGDSTRLPASIGYGRGTFLVLLPPTLRPKPGEALSGEFFLVRDSTIPVPHALADKPGSGLLYRLVYAQELRLPPEQYARALLDNAAELVEWSFRREQSRTSESYRWTRTVVPALAPAGTPPQAPPAERP